MTSATTRPGRRWRRRGDTCSAWASPIVAAIGEAVGGLVSSVSTMIMPLVDIRPGTIRRA